MTEPQITSEVARQILYEAERNGVTADVYLKNIADENGEIKQASIKYDFTDSQKWLAENAKNYIGEWIVLDGARLIGSGENPLPIVEKARREGVEIPFVQFISESREPFMGGWL
jgi:hypothetical protein